MGPAPVSAAQNAPAPNTSVAAASSSASPISQTTPLSPSSLISPPAHVSNDLVVSASTNGIASAIVGSLSTAHATTVAPSVADMHSAAIHPSPSSSTSVLSLSRPVHIESPMRNSEGGGLSLTSSSVRFEQLMEEQRSKLKMLQQQNQAMMEQLDKQARQRPLKTADKPGAYVGNKFSRNASSSEHNRSAEYAAALAAVETEAEKTDDEYSLRRPSLISEQSASDAKQKYVSASLDPPSDYWISSGKARAALTSTTHKVEEEQKLLDSSAKPSSKGLAAHMHRLLHTPTNAANSPLSHSAPVITDVSRPSMNTASDQYGPPVTFDGSQYKAGQLPLAVSQSGHNISHASSVPVPGRSLHSPNPYLQFNLNLSTPVDSNLSFSKMQPHGSGDGQFTSHLPVTPALVPHNLSQQLVHPLEQRLYKRLSEQPISPNSALRTATLQSHIPISQISLKSEPTPHTLTQRSEFHAQAQNSPSIVHSTYPIDVLTSAGHQLSRKATPLSVTPSGPSLIRTPQSVASQALHQLAYSPPTSTPVPPTGAILPNHETFLSFAQQQPSLNAPVASQMFASYPSQFHVPEDPHASVLRQSPQLFSHQQPDLQQQRELASQAFHGYSQSIAPIPASQASLPASDPLAEQLSLTIDAFMGPATGINMAPRGRILDYATAYRVLQTIGVKLPDVDVAIFSSDPVHASSSSTNPSLAAAAFEFMRYVRSMHTILI